MDRVSGANDGSGDDVVLAVVDAKRWLGGTDSDMLCLLPVLATHISIYCLNLVFVDIIMVFGFMLFLFYESKSCAFLHR